MSGSHISRGLARCLLRHQLIHDIESTCLAAGKMKLSLIPYVIQEKKITATHLAKVIADDFKLPYLDLHEYRSAPLIHNLIAPHLIKKHHILPLKKVDNQLHCALADPTDLNALDEIKFHSHLDLQLFIVDFDQLNTTIEQLFNQQMRDDRLDDNFDDNAIDEQPIITFVNQLLGDAAILGE